MSGGDGHKPVEQQEHVDSLNTQAWDLTLGAPEQALRVSQAALEEARAIDYEQGAADAHINIGWCHIFSARADAALDSFIHALEIFSSLGDQTGEAKATNAIGVTYQDLGQYDISLEYYRRSLDAALRLQDKGRIAASLNNVGEVCLRLGRGDEAMQYFHRALESARSNDEKQTLATILCNIGSSYRVRGQLEEARHYIDEALRLAKASADRNSQSEAHVSYGLLHLENNDHNAARQAFRKALEVAQQVGNKRAQIEVLLQLGESYTSESLYDDALEVLTEAVVLGESSGTGAADTRGARAYLVLSELYERWGNAEEALAYMKRYSRAQHELFVQTSAVKLKSVEARHKQQTADHLAEIFRLRNVELRKKQEELEASNRRLQTLSEIGIEITSRLDLESLMEQIYRSVNDIMDAAGFGIALVDNDRKRIHYALFIERGERIAPYERSIDASDSFGAWCVRNRQELVLNDVDARYSDYVKARKSTSGRYRARSLVYMPLLVQDELIGLVTVQSYHKNAYSDDDVQSLRALGGYIATAIHNSLIVGRVNELNAELLAEKKELQAAYGQIAHMANHDKLTELPNRRLLTELVSQYIPLAQRRQEIFAVMYVDLDNFKPINDAWGHRTGDEVLIRMARRFTQSVRQSDIVARIGGDEFVVVLRDIGDHAHAISIAEKILAQLQKPLSSEFSDIRPSASVGIAMYPTHGSTLDELLVHADNAMYGVKRAGKDGVRIYQKD